MLQGGEAIIKWHFLFQKKKGKMKEIPHSQESPWCWPIRNYPTSCHQPLAFISFRVTYYWLLVRLYGRDQWHSLWLPLQVLIWQLLIEQVFPAAEHLDIHYSLSPGVQEICISLALLIFLQLIQYVSSTLPVSAWNFTNGIFTIRRLHSWISFQSASCAHSC